MDSTQQDPPLRIGVVVGSSRPGRRGDQVAHWVLAHAREHAPDTDFVLVDLAGYALPMLDEPAPAAIGDYRNPHTLRWAQAIAPLDGFVFVTPEYNHSMPAVLKNAVDYLFAEWNDKAAGFVGYGLGGGHRAVEHLRGTLAEVKVACVRSQVALSLRADFAIDDIIEPGTFAPAGHHAAQLDRMLDEVREWAGALRPLRTRPADPGMPFTMLIEFDVPPEHQQELAAALTATIDETLPGVDGFLSATVSSSVDGGTVVNYAQWTTRAAWEAATGLDAAARRDGNWAETQRGRWFGEDVPRNPVLDVLTRLGGSTRRVTAFDRASRVGTAR